MCDKGFRVIRASIEKTQAPYHTGQKTHVPYHTGQKNVCPLSHRSKKTHVPYHTVWYPICVIRDVTLRMYYQTLESDKNCSQTFEKKLIDMSVVRTAFEIVKNVYLCNSTGKRKAYDSDVS